MRMAVMGAVVMTVVGIVWFVSVRSGFGFRGFEAEFACRWPGVFVVCARSLRGCLWFWAIFCGVVGVHDVVSLYAEHRYQAELNFVVLLLRLE